MDELIKKLGETLAEQVTKSVMENVRRELLLLNKQAFQFCYSEEEAAQKLGVDRQSLYRKRKSGEIDYSRSPSGKPVYLPRHIDEYLARHEIRSGKSTSSLAAKRGADFSKLKLAG